MNLTHHESSPSQSELPTDPELNLPGHGGHRSLKEGVLQSAEEALKSSAEPVVLYADDAGAVHAPTHAPLYGVEHGSATRMRGEDGWTPEVGAPAYRERDGWLNSLENGIARYVAVKPFRAAAFAVGIGALATALMGRRRGRPRGRPGR